MSWFAQHHLNPGVKKREVFGWAMYDFANSGYTTVVLTAVFSAYFTGVVAGKCRVGHVRLDIGVVDLLCDRDGHDAEHRCAGRFARGEKTLSGLIATIGCVVVDGGPRPGRAGAGGCWRWCW